MTTDPAFLALLQLTDGLFPAGGFAHSFGLETYVQEGRVDDAAGPPGVVVAPPPGGAGARGAPGGGGPAPAAPPPPPAGGGGAPPAARPAEKGPHGPRPAAPHGGS